jgi:hypothetical protein
MNCRALRAKLFLKFRMRQISGPGRGHREIEVRSRDLFDFLKIITVIGRDEKFSVFSQCLANRA